MIDVLIQTYNEELNLPHTLKSLEGWVNRIFIVDSGSTDATVEIAKAAGAEVVHHAFEGYAKQKNWALDHLEWQSPWILILDADESVTPNLRYEIYRITLLPPDEVPEAAFYLNRVFIFMGREIRHCGYFPSWNMRLFKRGLARYEERLVHEHMIAQGPVGHLKHLLLHEDRRGLEHFIAKHNRYSTLEAQEMVLTYAPWPGLRAFWSNRVLRVRFLKSRVLPHFPLPWLWRFVYMFIFRLGILDGAPGWVLCNLISTYQLFILTKYRELRRFKPMDPLPRSGLKLPEGSLGAVQRASLYGTGIQPASSGQAESLHHNPSAPAFPTKGEVVTAPASVSRQPKAPVSVIIPTLNEAANIARCLDHLQWADEVVVVDSGSKDRTRAIAEAYGATVIQFQWNGQWPKKKNWTLRHAPLKHDWVLIVDADEWITPPLAAEITQAISSDKSAGYYINRKFMFMGRWIKHCGYYPSWNLRLLKRGSGEYEQLTDIGNTGSGDNEVHEHIVVDGPVEYLKEDMLHFAFPTIHTFMEKHNRYSNWEAAVQFQGIHHGTATPNKDLSRRRRLRNLSRHLPFRPFLRFCYSYFWKGGFLDGKAGYVFCRLLSIYEYLSVAKYYELARADADRRKVQGLSDVPPAIPEEVVASLPIGGTIK